MRSIAGSSDRPTYLPRQVQYLTGNTRQKSGTFVRVIQLPYDTILIVSLTPHRQNTSPQAPHLIRCPHRHRSSYPSRGRIINPAGRRPAHRITRKFTLAQPPVHKESVSHAQRWQGQHRTTTSKTEGKSTSIITAHLSRGLIDRMSG